MLVESKRRIESTANIRDVTYYACGSNYVEKSDLIRATNAFVITSNGITETSIVSSLLSFNEKTTIVSFSQFHGTSINMFLNAKHASIFAVR